MEAIQEFAIGIMPLGDGDWQRGKCGLKLLVYLACGKAVVASPVGANCDIVGTDRGFLATTQEEWVDALIALLDNPSLAVAMGRAGRSFVEQSYSVEVIAPRIARALREAADHRSCH